jgi:hypothetical protein
MDVRKSEAMAKVKNSSPKNQFMGMGAEGNKLS